MTETAAQTPAAPPESGLYVGRVMHARSRPMQHKLDYRVFSLWIDLADVDGAVRRAKPLLRRGRVGLASFREGDHGDGSDTPLHDQALAAVAKMGLRPVAPRVFLLCFPRVLGYVFNPLSIYYVYDGDRPIAVLHEVRNTFGDMHTYAIPVQNDRHPGAPIEQTCAKGFHVSPFIGMQGQYRFRLSPPGPDLRISIRESDAAGPFLIASHVARWRPLTPATLGALLLRMPLLTLKIIGGIHFEALKLWRKGATYHRRPTPPSDRISFHPPVSPGTAARDAKTVAAE